MLPASEERVDSAARDGPNKTILCLLMTTSVMDRSRHALAHAATASASRERATSALTLPTAASLPSSSTNSRCQISRASISQIPCSRSPRPGEPAGQRNGEAHFAAVDRLLGNVSLGETLENDLRAQPADLQMLRQARGELDELVVEERNASLDARSHAHAVALDQDVVHQPGVNVAIEEAIESAVAVTVTDDFVESLRQSAVTDFVSHRAGKHAGLKLRIEAPVPRREAARSIGYGEDLRHAAQTPALERQSARNTAQESVPNS